MQSWDVALHDGWAILAPDCLFNVGESDDERDVVS